MVGNGKDKFSHDEAQLILSSESCHKDPKNCANLNNLVVIAIMMLKMTMIMIIIFQLGGFTVEKNEPRCEKTGLRGFRPGPTQTGLYNHRRWLEA